MTFSVRDYRDLITLLAEHPEWRAEFAPLILGDEVLALPAAMAALTARIGALTEGLETLEQRMDALTAQMTALAQAVISLTETVRRMDSRLGRVEGRTLEARYYNHVQAWFGRWLRKPQVISVDDLPRVEQAINEGRLSADDEETLRTLDILVRGIDREQPSEGELLVAVAVSQSIDEHDVDRAADRAELLTPAGYRAIGVAAGEALSGRAVALAKRRNVRIDLRTP
ncbi:MAG: hypothetical protein ACR2HN_02250 [Tepidiformaceae bacterium]